jgi:hypothetical protein
VKNDVKDIYLTIPSCSNMYDQEREDDANKLVPLTGDTLVNKSTAENISDAVKLISKIH